MSRVFLQTTTRAALYALAAAMLFQVLHATAAFESIQYYFVFFIASKLSWDLLQMKTAVSALPPTHF